MQSIIDFFDSPFFIVVGGISTLVTVLTFLYGIYLFAKGIFPVWLRLGMGLSNRKIAVFAENDEYTSLKGILVESGIFQDGNILKVHKGELKSAEKYSLFLMYWKDFQADIDEILRMKKNSTALIVYAPQRDGFIDKPIMEKINEQRNTIIVNFKGRLINDLLMSMITTGYKEK